MKINNSSFAFHHSPSRATFQELFKRVKFHNYIPTRFMDSCQSCKKIKTRIKGKRVKNVKQCYAEIYHPTLRRFRIFELFRETFYSFSSSSRQVNFHFFVFIFDSLNLKFIKGEGFCTSTWKKWKLYSGILIPLWFSLEIMFMIYMNLKIFFTVQVRNSSQWK